MMILAEFTGLSQIKVFQFLPLMCQHLNHISGFVDRICHRHDLARIAAPHLHLHPAALERTLRHGQANRQANQIGIAKLDKASATTPEI